MKTLKVFTVILILFSSSRSFAQDSTTSNQLTRTIDILERIFPKGSLPSISNSTTVVYMPQSRIDSIRNTPESIKMDSIKTIIDKQVTAEYNEASKKCQEAWEKFKNNRTGMNEQNFLKADRELWFMRGQMITRRLLPDDGRVFNPY
jgi:hypothetical protein